MIRAHKRNGSRTTLIILYIQGKSKRTAKLLYSTDGIVTYTISRLYNPVRSCMHSCPEIDWSSETYIQKNIRYKRSQLSFL